MTKEEFEILLETVPDEAELIFTKDRHTTHIYKLVGIHVVERKRPEPSIHEVFLELEDEKT